MNWKGYGRIVAGLIRIPAQNLSGRLRKNTKNPSKDSQYRDRDLNIGPHNTKQER
jgi:hypothetical protein